MKPLSLLVGASWIVAPKKKPSVNWWKVAVSRNQRMPTVALSFGTTW